MALENRRRPCHGLNDLEDKVMFHIFFFLGVNDTARLGAVSKKLRELCKRSPHLYFRIDFDPDRLSTYIQSIRYVDALLRMRDAGRAGLKRFLIHWRCDDPRYDIGKQTVAGWLNIATAQADFRELDVLLESGREECVHVLPECIHNCPSLRSVKLNLDMGKLFLRHRRTDSIEELWLDKIVLAGDKIFGHKIGFWWTSLKRLNLVSVLIKVDLIIQSGSLEELTIRSCKLAGGNTYGDWHIITVSGPSLKTFTISGSCISPRSQILLTCQLLENFTICDSIFDRCSVLEIQCASLENVQIDGSKLGGSFEFTINSPTVKQIKVSHCKFNDICLFNTNCLSIQECTVSECKTNVAVSSDPNKSIWINADRLKRMNLNSSDIKTREFPLGIRAPKMEAIRWVGNPLDFSHLENFTSLMKATVDLKPPCVHKRKEFARLCKLSKSKIYCVARLLESLKTAITLSINIWPIELFFMQNDMPPAFNNLQFLELLADDLLPDQISVIAYFLKGLHDLRVLTIRCDKTSPSLVQPNLIEQLGLQEESFVVTVSPDLKTVEIVVGASKVKEVDSKAT